MGSVSSFVPDQKQTVTVRRIQGKRAGGVTDSGSV
jgi:hypothetical protein